MSRRRCCCVAPVIWTPYCEDATAELCRFSGHDAIPPTIVLDLGSGGWTDGCGECDDIFKGEWDLPWGVSSGCPHGPYVTPPADPACEWGKCWKGSDPDGPVCDRTDIYSWVVLRVWIETVGIGGWPYWQWRASAFINVMNDSPVAPYNGYSGAFWKSAAMEQSGQNRKTDCMYGAVSGKVQLNKIGESHYKHYPGQGEIPCIANGGLPDPVYVWPTWD